MKELLKIINIHDSDYWPWWRSDDLWPLDGPDLVRTAFDVWVKERDGEVVDARCGQSEAQVVSAVQVVR